MLSNSSSSRKNSPQMMVFQADSAQNTFGGRAAFRPTGRAYSTPPHLAAFRGKMHGEWKREEEGWEGREVKQGGKGRIEKFLNLPRAPDDQQVPPVAMMSNQISVNFSQQSFTSDHDCRFQQ